MSAPRRTSHHQPATGPRPFRTPRLAALAGVLTLAACADEGRSPTAPIRPPHVARSSAGGGGKPELRPNSQQYRQNTYKNATGRDGSASLTARALLGKDGRTALEVTTGALDQPGAPGTIAKMQVKLLDPNKAEQATENFNNLDAGGTFAHAYAGRPRHSWIQVQGNIRGIDRNRTGVVTLTERVNLRPDLAVTSLAAPPKAKPNLHVMITATVRELNSDVGAGASCVLYIDGARADQAEGIWVADAGTVACDFAHAFAATGTHTIKVAVESVVPGDWDAANNAKETTIEIVSPETPLQGSVSAYDYRNRSGWSNRGSWQNYLGESGRWENASENSHGYQGASLWGWAPGSFDNTRAEFQLSITSAGGDAGSGNTLLAFSGTPAWSWGDETYSCAGAWDNYHYFQACSYGNGTWLAMGFHAYEVAYFSRGFSEWTDVWGGSYSYYYNYGWGNGYGTMRPMGTSLAFSVRMTDGANTYVASPTLEMVTWYDYGGASDEQCTSYSDWWGSQTYCSRSSNRNSYRSNWAAF